MKCQILFPGEREKNVINLPSVLFAQRVVNFYVKYFLIMLLCLFWYLNISMSLPCHVYKKVQ